MFSTSQFISLLLVPLAIVMLVVPRVAGTAGARARIARRGRSVKARDRSRNLITVSERTATACASIGFSRRVLADQSRSQIQRLIKDGHVTVGGARGEGQPRRCKTGQDVRRSTCPSRSTATPQPRRCRCRSSTRTDLVVVDKPAGMVVHPAAGHASGTLVNALLHHVDDLSGIGGEMRPGIVHRLDRGTSGLMVVAKNDAAHEELARQFHDREVEKEYIALVWGVVQAGRRIDAPIGRDPVEPQEDVDAGAARRERGDAHTCAPSTSTALTLAAASPSRPAARIRSACT